MLSAGNGFEGFKGRDFAQQALGAASEPMRYQLEFEIESSKEHWTELDSETSLSGEELVAANREVFERLREQFRCPKTGECFFHDWGERLTLGAKIAEGGQAEIFSAELRGEDGSIHDKIVVKAFKSGYCLKDLEHQWPQGMFVTRSVNQAILIPTELGGKQDRNADKISTHFIHENCCFIHGGTLLANGRFGFVLERYWGDLRRLIDLKRRGSREFYVGNFTNPKALAHNMLRIAKGMLKLHEHRILHRDLKASNVLVHLRDSKDDGDLMLNSFQEYHLDVADFESSVGVIGTGFWRAPEVLLGLKNRSLGPKTSASTSNFEKHHPKPRRETSDRRITIFARALRRKVHRLLVGYSADDGGIEENSCLEVWIGSL